MSFFFTMTMYRAMLLYLVFLVLGAVLFSTLSLLPFHPLWILGTALYLVLVCHLANRLLALIFRVAPNQESSVITALILTLIVGPYDLISHIFFLTLLALVAMAVKYLVVFQKQHIFNPAAAAVLLVALIGEDGASWWVGNSAMMPLVLGGGLLMARKLRRFHLVIAFGVAYFALLSLDAIVNQQAGLVQAANLLWNIAAVSPLFFFAFVMLVEPVSEPPTCRQRLSYGALIGALLFVFQRTLFVPYTLELSLLVGNAFSRMVNPRGKTTLTLVGKKRLSSQIMSFWFQPQKALRFAPGQFLEWSLPHASPDSRGTRRYFTIASSPTEKHILLITKFAEKSSSFKRVLRSMKPGDGVMVSPAAGDFTLPKNLQKPLVFIAGGVGITPFRSMIRFLLDMNLSSNIILLYSNRSREEVIGEKIFQEATQRFGLKTIYAFTHNASKDRKGRAGYIDKAMIEKEVPGYRHCVFYISGPEPMVEAFEKMLATMGIEKQNIKRDYFPGYRETHQPHPDFL